VPLPERFGPYEVVAHIEGGGQGEVYRARDVRLNRDVAIKVLPHPSVDPSRERRLLEEARAASALNHPNIVTVYDVGTMDGRSFVVSELIAGSSLRTVLTRAPLPMRELLDLAVQMADGLAAAHREGIVHCDFKPGNVMVTPDGRVKILDFGLARMTNDDTGTPDENTASLKVAVEGTPPYMSPEQACGGAMDHRSDQFSFGLTLYEMATGRRAFAGKTNVQVLAAIIDDEPPSIATVNPKVPAPLRWLIERCLSKDKRDRYDTTNDLARDLRTLRSRLPEFAPPEIVSAGAVSRWRRLAFYARWVGLFAVAGAGVWIASAPVLIDLRDFKLTPIAVDAGYQDQPAWNPDGQTLAYVADVDGVLQIFTKTLNSPGRYQVTHRNFDCRFPFWSHDGKRIYFISQAGFHDALWSIASIAGEPEKVLDEVSSAALSPDGRVLATFRPGQSGSNPGLWLSSDTGSNASEYTIKAFSETVYADAVLRFSSDSSLLGIWVNRWATESARAMRELWIVPMHDGQPIRHEKVSGASDGLTSFSWLKDGRVVEAIHEGGQTSSHLWVGNSDGSGMRKLTQTPDGEDAPAVSPNGTQIAFAMQQANFDIVTLPLLHNKVRDGQLAINPLIATTRNEMAPSYSPVRNQLAYVTDEPGRQEIWMRTTGAGDAQRIVSGTEVSASVLDGPQFSHDGQNVAFYGYVSSMSPTNHIFIKPIRGGSAALVDITVVAAKNTPTWSPNDAEIAYASGNSGNWSLLKKQRGAGRKPETIADDVQQFSIARWSPDGNWVAYQSVKGLAIAAPNGTGTRHLQGDGDEREWLEFTWEDKNPSTWLIGVRVSDDGKHLTYSSVNINTKVEQVLAENFMPLPVSSRPIAGFTIMGNVIVTSIPRVQSGIWMLEGFDEAHSLWQRLTSWIR